MPRASRSVKSKAPSPAPLRALEGEDHVVEQTLEKVEQEEREILVVQDPTPSARVKGKGKATDADRDEEDEQTEASRADDAQTGESSRKLTPEERLAKVKELRRRMNQSTAANRKDLIEDHQKQQTTARELARLEKQRKIAEVLREKIEAEEAGEDLERKKNWDWTIEDNERWDAKQQAIKEKTKFEFDDHDSRAQRTYQKNTEKMQVDLKAYQKQKELALGLEPGALSGAMEKAIAANADSQAVTRVQHELGNTGMRALGGVYGTHKPSEDAIDRVVGKLNQDRAASQAAKLKKRARDNDSGDVNYINEQNKVFNKKIARYFDKYTSEIRANFERGTAL